MDISDNISKLAKEEWRHYFVDFFNKYLNISEKISVDILNEKDGIPMIYEDFLVNGSKDGNYYWDIIKKYEETFNPRVYHWASFYVPIDTILKNPSPHWVWDNISLNLTVTWQHVLENPSYPWNFYYLSSNKNFTFEIAQAYPEPYEIIRVAAAASGSYPPPDEIWPNKYNWNYCNLTYNTPIKTILENLRYDWDIVYLSEKVTMANVLAHPEIRWSELELSSNPNITMEDIVEHQEIMWDYEEVSVNPNFTLDTPKKYPHIDWKYTYYSSNKNITLETIQDNPDFNWNYIELSKNPKIPLSYINSTLSKGWDFDMILLHNEEITLDIIADLITQKKINKYKLYSNYFDNQYASYFIKQYNVLSKDYNSYVKSRTAHFERMQEIHIELIDVLFSPDNYWYIENLR